MAKQHKKGLKANGKLAKGCRYVKHGHGRVTCKHGKK